MADTIRPTLEEVARYAHLEDVIENDDVQKQELASFVAAAIGYMKGAGVTRNDDNADTYDLVVKCTAAEWFDNRTTGDVSPKCQKVFNQLKLGAAILAGGGIS